jgi:hypothetical protein
MKIAPSYSVIPAKAGTHFDFRWVVKVNSKIKVGPRFRGDDDLGFLENVRR